MMKKIYISLLFLSGFSGQVYSAEIDQANVNGFISSFYQAIHKHDMATVSKMIDDQVTIKIILAETTPQQTFTLTKADYLQQWKATWRFASDEKYELKNVKVSTVNGLAVVSLQEKQNRVFFGKKTVQENDLNITLNNNQNRLKIVAINSNTKLD